MKYDVYYKVECSSESSTDTFMALLKKSGFEPKKISNVSVEVEVFAVDKQTYRIFMDLINTVSELSHSLVIRQVK